MAQAISSDATTDNDIAAEVTEESNPLSDLPNRFVERMGIIIPTDRKAEKIITPETTTTENLPVTPKTSEVLNILNDMSYEGGIASSGLEVNQIQNNILTHFNNTFYWYHPDAPPYTRRIGGLIRHELASLIMPIIGYIGMVDQMLSTPGRKEEPKKDIDEEPVDIDSEEFKEWEEAVGKFTGTLEQYVQCYKPILEILEQAENEGIHSLVSLAKIPDTIAPSERKKHKGHEWLIINGAEDHKREQMVTIEEFFIIRTLVRNALMANDGNIEINTILSKDKEERIHYITDNSTTDWDAEKQLEIDSMFEVGRDYSQAPLIIESRGLKMLAFLIGQLSADLDDTTNGYILKPTLINASNKGDFIKHGVMFRFPINPIKRRLLS